MTSSTKQRAPALCGNMCQPRAWAAIAIATGLMTSSVDSLDNGVARTPPMGWRNWNFFQGAITQEIMETQMKAMTTPFLPIVGLDGRDAGANASLLDAGYTHAGLDVSKLMILFVAPCMHVMRMCVCLSVCLSVCLYVYV